MKYIPISTLICQIIAVLNFYSLWKLSKNPVYRSELNLFSQNLITLHIPAFSSLPLSEITYSSLQHEHNQAPRATTAERNHLHQSSDKLTFLNYKPIFFFPAIYANVMIAFPAVLTSVTSHCPSSNLSSPPHPHSYKSSNPPAQVIVPDSHKM